MPTIKQKQAVEKMVENGGVVSRAMLDVGYSPATAKTPQKLTESTGFKELCEEAGLTDDLLVTALVEDIQEKKGNRKAELELGFKVKGRLKENEDMNTNRPQPILNFIFNVSGNNGNEEGSRTQEAVEDSSGRDISE